jgi:hypothetical protein
VSTKTPTATPPPTDVSTKTPTATPPPTDVPTKTPTATTPPTDVPTKTPTATTPPPGLPPGSVEAKVRQALGKQIGVDAGKLRLTAKHAQEWPDSALGCPAPGRAYSQIVTPGFKLTYRRGAKTYDVHTDQSGDQAVLCQNKHPIELPTAAD